MLSLNVKKLTQYFWWCLGLLVTIALLSWALRDINLIQVGQAFQTAKPTWVIIALITFLTSFSLRAKRWGTLLGATRDPGSFQIRQTAVFIGFAGNCVLPAHGGEVLRGLVLKRFGGIPFPVAVGSIFTERLLDVVVAFILLLLALWSISQQGVEGVENIPVGWIALPLIGLGTGFFLAAWCPHWMLKILQHVLRVLPGARWKNTLLTIVQSILEGLEALRYPRRTFLALLETFGVWGLTGITYWGLMQAFEIHQPLAGAFFVQGLVALAIALPSSPGYLGPFEAAIRFGLERYAVPPDTIIAFALLLRALMYLSLMTVALILALRLGLNWRDFSPVFMNRERGRGQGGRGAGE
ncbi:lysylphosphatidylglycerol synthase transmembrane domain-containing protein [Spirulina subsalsa]|uniref:lysylphosphatidylglycerol synthase transmembrane domain-containing protein n=1 Tax=Spirulina subsalsa TaxID=54311 RepID=UPI00030C7897|nr:lysylphosphatidylglycerol synthase transmembrane domain-containing protein [Spirulina subsalsa]